MNANESLLVGFRGDWRWSEGDGERERADEHLCIVYKIARINPFGRRRCLCSMGARECWCGPSVCAAEHKRDYNVLTDPSRCATDSNEFDFSFAESSGKAN